MKRKSGFLKNTLILFIAMFITKIIGAVLRIPLTNMLGGVGMGYFSTAYSFFNPVYTVLAAGLPIIVTKLTAQSVVCHRYKETRKIKNAALILSFAAGVLGMVFMFVFAIPFANYAASSPDSLWSVLAITPSIIFCCLAAAYRGYYEGLTNMMPTAVSQVIESVVKAVFGLGLSGVVLHMGEQGIIHSDKILPYAAAAAVLGVTFGEFCGTLFLMIRSRFFTDSITETDLELSAETLHKRELIKKIISQSLPISAGAVIINVGSLIDLLTISSGIQKTLYENQSFFISHYPAAYSEAGTDLFGNFVYGSYTGIVLSIFMIITSMTALVGKSSLPGIASACECGSKEEVDRHVSILLSGIFVIGLPLCFSLGVLSEPFLSLLYPVRMAEVSVSVMPLSILCIGGVPIALCGGLFSVFQAVGRSDLPIKLMMAGSALKLILNLLLINIPQFSVSGAAVSTVCSHVLVMLLGIILLRNSLGIRCRILSLFLKPAFASAVCAAVALLAYYKLFDNFHSVIRMCLTVAVGGTAYIVILLLVDRRIVNSIIGNNYSKTTDS